ncbi:hypothetical protein GMB86_01235 [Terrilactibacillus sp. BCM23-1]|uniref:Uncharacterized protein n=1 Tax=Terrilactibacillus tamarindi TaxID=2599694 RepID=A0A6N8CRN2_9BACI|nr:hypothetical protein [Terrilactibacillus tamarindi]MTT30636.1 hypothetical protein [Terrilactibacillus tamarindi]
MQHQHQNQNFSLAGNILPILGAVGTGALTYMCMQNMQNGQSPLEQVGQTVQNAGQQVGQTVSQAGQTVQQAGKTAGKMASQPLDTAGDTIKKMSKNITQ